MTIYYTGSGDDGSTGVMGKGRVQKDSCMTVALGEIDELNSVVGVAIANTSDDYINRMLNVIQNKLFVIGAEISASIEGGAKPKTSISEETIKDLEKQIDEIGATLPELKKFVLPGGSISSAYLHLARSVARRAERATVALSKDTKINPNILKYLNRLSSFFFATALYVNKKEGIDETNPAYS
jgi:cob(I)alamin adenosyltransferase